MSKQFEIKIIETVEVYKKLLVETDEDTDGKNLGYLDGEDLNTDVEGYNATVVKVLYEESDVINRTLEEVNE